jgi:hypothetical protein
MIVCVVLIQVIVGRRDLGRRKELQGAAVAPAE